MGGNGFGAVVVAGSWHRFVEPVTLAVDCGRLRHQIRWAEGQVDALDHDNLDAERALMAFGGAPVACVALIDLWDDLVSDGAFLGEWAPLGFGAQRRSWLAAALERMASEGYHEFLRAIPMARASQMARGLLAFPEAWLLRAAAEHSARVEASLITPSPPVEQFLVDAISVRARRAFVASLVGRGLPAGRAALTPLAVHVSNSETVSAWGELGGSGGSRSPHNRQAPHNRQTLLRNHLEPVSVVLPRGWLHRVWAPGMGVIGPYLVLDATFGSEPNARVTAATWDQGRAMVVTGVATWTGVDWEFER